MSENIADATEPGTTAVAEDGSIWILREPGSALPWWRVNSWIDAPDGEWCSRIIAEAANLTELGKADESRELDPTSPTDLRACAGLVKESVYGDSASYVVAVLHRRADSFERRAAAEAEKRAQDAKRAKAIRFVSEAMGAANGAAYAGRLLDARPDLIDAIISGGDQS